MNKQTILIFSSFLFVLLAGCGLYFKFKKNKSTEAPYTTCRPTKQTITQYVQASGTLEAEETIIVGSLVAGRVQQIHAYENDQVKKGDKLVTLDDGIGTDNIKRIKALIEQRKAELTFQQKEFERKKSLFTLKHLSEEAFDEATKTLGVAQALFDQAHADLQLAEHAYDNLTIRAPDDGVIIARNVELGQGVTAVLNATELYLIAQDINKMKAKIDVDEADIGKVKMNTPVSFYVDAFPTKEYTSQISLITYKSKITNAVVSFNAEFLINNSQHLLRPGMTVNVDIEVSKTENQLALPLKALRISDSAIEALAKKVQKIQIPLPQKETRTQQMSVWTVKDNQFIEKVIVTGAQNRQYIAVLEGVTEQDEVVISINESVNNPLVSQITKGKIGG
jgi:HlyD family secretion protein